MTDDELREIWAGVERCEATHAGQEYPFCENYGCMSVRPLLDEIEQLREALRGISNVLDGGVCTQANCEGCHYEMGEAAQLAIAALTQLSQSRGL